MTKGKAEISIRIRDLPLSTSQADEESMDGTPKPTRRKRRAMDHVFVERDMKDRQVRRKWTPLSTVSTPWGTCCGSIIFAIIEKRHHLRASQHQRWEVRDPKGGWFGHKKQACSGPGRLSIIVYRRSWREMFLRNTSDFHEELKSGKGRPLENPPGWEIRLNKVRVPRRCG